MTPIPTPGLTVADAVAELREAATLMRERAEAATPGRWIEMHLGSEGCQVLRDCGMREGRGRRNVGMFTRHKEWEHCHADAAYVAGMQPAVALAVANMLDELACEATNGPSGLVMDGLVIARAFLEAARNGGQP